jgi:hypothetical protein
MEHWKEGIPHFSSTSNIHRIITNTTSSMYPDAHLLGIPVEVRELIYDFLTDEPTKLWHRNTPIHVSASAPPPLEVLLAHRTLYNELLPHFYRRTILTLHIDAYDAAKSDDEGNAFRAVLAAYPPIKHTRVIEIRPRLNACVSNMKDHLDPAISVLLTEAKELRTVIVGWSEQPQFFMACWRPWPYKAAALEPLKRLVGKVKIECGKVAVPPPTVAEMEQAGLEREVEKMIVRGEEENGVTRL